MRMTCLGALPSSRPVVNCCSNPIPIGSVLLLPFMEHSICGIRSVFKEPYDVNLKELWSFFCSTFIVPVNSGYYVSATLLLNATFRICYALRSVGIELLCRFYM